MTATTREKAWEKIREMMPSANFAYSEQSSANAGYSIYRDENDFYNYVCDLGDRLEVNISDGSTCNIWIIPETETKNDTRLTATTSKKTYNLSFESFQFVYGMLCKVASDAYLDLDADCTLAEVADFMSKAGKIFKAANKARENNGSFTIQLTSCEYYSDGNNNLHSNNFNCWTCISENNDGDGFYFAPDTRYTPAHHDIYLHKKTALADLMQTLNF